MTQHAFSGTPPVLATPCTAQALRVWLNKVDIMSPGTEKLATITTTTSTITAS